jgi:hypothetical protein
MHSHELRIMKKSLTPFSMQMILCEEKNCGMECYVMLIGIYQVHLT